MWPFSRELEFPGIKFKGDGKTVEFTLTPEEQHEAEAALAEFKEYLVLKKHSERFSNGVIAVALSRYARRILLARRDEFLRATGKLSSELQSVMATAIAAVWKSSIFSPLPILFFIARLFLVSWVAKTRQSVCLLCSSNSRRPFAQTR